MSTHRSLVAGFALLIAAVLPTASKAEVVAETDAFGNYVRTSVMTQSLVRQVRVWRPMRRHGIWGAYLLNPDGDRFGDQYPTVAENPRERNLPWVVWSRFNGHDFDLVWSRWQRPQGWAPVRWVDDVREAGDDIAPRIAFDVTGRPYLVWWRDDGGTGKVFLSLWLITRWASPLMISDLGIDSRNPRVAVFTDGTARVEYQSPGGTETRLVSFQRPTTITDDLDPMNQFSVTRPPGSGGQSATNFPP